MKTSKVGVKEKEASERHWQGLMKDGYGEQKKRKTGQTHPERQRAKERWSSGGGAEVGR